MTRWWKRDGRRRGLTRGTKGEARTSEEWPPERASPLYRYRYPKVVLLFIKGGGGILREILSSRIRTKSGGACSIGTGKGVSGSGSPRDRNGIENGGREDATFLRPPW